MSPTSDEAENNVVCQKITVEIDNLEFDENGYRAEGTYDRDLEELCIIRCKEKRRREGNRSNNI